MWIGFFPDPLFLGYRFQLIGYFSIIGQSWQLVLPAQFAHLPHVLVKSILGNPGNDKSSQNFPL
jgi:hypothetical protein